MSRAFFLRPAAVGFVAAFALASPAGAQVAGRQVVGTSTATLSPAIRVGDVLYLSGQLGMSRESPDSTIGGQTKRALDNIKAVVEQAGATMGHITKCTVFLTNVADFRGMNQVYSQAFPK